MNDHVPSLSTVVDVLTVRREYAESIGNDQEEAAMRQALTAVENHIFQEAKKLSLIARILIRLHLPRKAAA